MLDAILMEKRGIPAAAIGEEHLVKNTGRAMAKLHGLPDYPIATFHETRMLDVLENEDELRLIAKTVSPQVEAILVRK